MVSKYLKKFNAAFSKKNTQTKMNCLRLTTPAARAAGSRPTDPPPLLFNRYWRISTNPDTSKKKIEPPETYAGVFYGPTELIYEEKLKFGNLRKKKFILY